MVGLYVFGRMLGGLLILFFYIVRFVVLASLFGIAVFVVAAIWIYQRVLVPLGQR